MLVEPGTAVGEPTSQERRNAEQHDKRILGNVVQCDGARATISAYADDTEGAITGLWTVGKMISINLGSTRTVGLVYEIGKSDRAWSSEGQNPIEVSVELIGEVRDARRAWRQAGLRPRHHHLSAYRRHCAPHPQPRPAGGLRSRGASFDHHRHPFAGRDDRRQHRHRRHADAPFRHRWHHRRRQIHRGVAAVAQVDRCPARPAYPDPRPAQRVCGVPARVLRQGRFDDARPALLDVQARRIRRSVISWARDGAGRGRCLARSHPRRQEPVSQSRVRARICAVAATR